MVSRSGPPTPRGRRRDRRLDFGSGPGSRRIRDAALAVRAFSPNGTAPRTRSAPLDERRGDGLAHAARAPHRRQLVGSRAIPNTGKGARAWDWNGVVGGRTVHNGRYLVQLVGRSGGRDVHRALATTGDVRPDRGVRRHGRHGRTGGQVGIGVEHAALPERRPQPRLGAAVDGLERRGPLGAADHLGGRHDPHGERHRRLDRIHLARRAQRWPARARRRYTATLGVIDAAGNKARRSFALTVDTTAPVVSTAASPGVFSPDGDGTAMRPACRGRPANAGAGWSRPEGPRRCCARGPFVRPPAGP